MILSTHGPLPKTADVLKGGDLFRALSRPRHSSTYISELNLPVFELKLNCKTSSGSKMTILIPRPVLHLLACLEQAMLTPESV